MVFIPIAGAVAVRSFLAALFALVTATFVVRASWADDGDDEHRARQEAVKILLNHSHRVLVGWDVGDGEFARRVKLPPPVDLASHPDRKLQPGDAVVEVRCLVGASGGLSDEEASAILALPTIRELSVTGVVAKAPHGAVDASLVYIGKLPVLEELYLGTSTVGDEGVRHLKGLRSLRWLSLWNTKISDAALEHVSALRGLEGLNLRRTEVTDKGVRLLATLTSLCWLDLGETKIVGSGLESLGELKHLERLMLPWSPINDDGAAGLSALTSLRELDLSGTEITGAALAHLSKMRELETLRLEGIDLGRDGLRQMPHLAKLKELDLASTRIDDDALKFLERLPSLRKLYLVKCGISDNAVMRLSRLPSLKVVILGNEGSFTAAGVARLKELRPNLDVDWFSREDEEFRKAVFGPAIRDGVGAK